MATHEGNAAVELSWPSNQQSWVSQALCLGPTEKNNCRGRGESAGGTESSSVQLTSSGKANQQLELQSTSAFNFNSLKVKKYCDLYSKHQLTASILIYVKIPQHVPFCKLPSFFLQRQKASASSNKYLKANHVTTAQNPRCDHPLPQVRHSSFPPRSHSPQASFCQSLLSRNRGSGQQSGCCHPAQAW